MPAQTIQWPPRHDLFGVRVSRTTYEEAETLIIQAAAAHTNAVVTHLPVHGIVMAVRDPIYRDRINSFDIVAPDGQPVRWALNAFHAAHLQDRVYGPELMLRLCRDAASAQVGVYLYGSLPTVVTRLKANLISRYPTLQIVGCESPPFRPLTSPEIDSLACRINDSNAGLVFIGLGLPKQDLFAHELRSHIHAVQICVGAAFDFLARTKRMAPPWMQRAGVEWVFRLAQEPRRLWQRYLTTNTTFAMLVLRRLVLRQ
jgi:exopolysaccharide biosynthesis WecB/TagA/CpsF family protein